MRTRRKFETHHLPSWTAGASEMAEEPGSSAILPTPASVILVPPSKSMDERSSQKGISGGNLSTLQTMSVLNRVNAVHLIYSWGSILLVSIIHRHGWLLSDGNVNSSPLRAPPFQARVGLPTIRNESRRNESRRNESRGQRASKRYSAATAKKSTSSAVLADALTCPSIARYDLSLRRNVFSTRRVKSASA